MEKRLVLIYQFILRSWNALLAGTSLAGVAVFSLVPLLQKYTSIFIFLAANALVWTVIELKVQLAHRPSRDVLYPTMRIARPDIISDIEKTLKHSTPKSPVRVIMLGGRTRSMSDIVREIADDLKKNKVRGHLHIEMFSLDPEYISARATPADLSIQAQKLRNTSYGELIRGISSELSRLSSSSAETYSLNINIRHYKEDPHFYAYIIADDLLYWGTFTWSSVTGDFIGPENPCVRVTSSDPQFSAIRDWIISWTDLYRQSYDKHAGSATVS